MTTSEPSAEPTVFTADVVLFAVIEGHLSVLTVRRGKEPYLGVLALPGGHVAPGEQSHDAAARELREETGINVEPASLTLLGIYDDPGRDPRGRVVSSSYMGNLPEPLIPNAGSDAADASWVSVQTVLSDATTIAFDHKTIIRDALLKEDKNRG
ncbi:NUDIX domain-containing protein [Lentzea fradiae]|uniref:NUDIX domain-containing protein n=1 Tax=Lentzea fradiae TaxID=200378 RepID=UPI0015A1F45E|nr:NUDIX hydrolase [Lentzea fradiae]